MRRTLDSLLEALILLDDRVGRGKHSSDGPPAEPPGQGARVGRCLRPDGDHAPVGAAAVGVHPARAARRRPRTRLALARRPPGGPRTGARRAGARAGGLDHHIAHEPAAACLEPAEFRARHANDERSNDRRATVFLCGAYRFSGDVGEGLLGALPQVLPLSAAVGDPLRDVIAVLSRELAASEPGQQTVLDRLLDILLVLAIRTSFRTSGTAPRWFQASADPRLSAALQAIHD